ncbi:hypothetical protein PSAC2689_90099 [Paraburkholderia sacchari]
MYAYPTGRFISLRVRMNATGVIVCSVFYQDDELNGAMAFAFWPRIGYVPRRHDCELASGVTRRYAGELTVVLCISYYNVEICGPGACAILAPTKHQPQKVSS